MGTGLFYPEVNQQDNFKAKMSQIGNNTGNNVFWYALRHLLELEKIPYNYKETDYDLNKLDSIITTDLIWIRQGDSFVYLDKLIDELKIPLIPISVGLQADSYDVNFKISDETVRLLKKIEERAVMGVRGEYTASILEKHGIRQFAVIGCPSMYYWNNPELKIDCNVKYPQKILCNFKTFYGKLNQKEKHFLAYMTDRKATFIEQTIHEMKQEQIDDEAYYKYVTEGLLKNKKIFFTITSWLEETCTYDFSIGPRFHGNVVSLWNNIKALFMTVDSRTKELVNHFKLPSISMQEFDRFKPIEYYYNKADYSDFHKTYSKCVDEFQAFLVINDLKIKSNTMKMQFANTSSMKDCYIKNMSRKNTV